MAKAFFEMTPKGVIDEITKYYHNFAKIIGDNKAKVVLAKLGNDAGIYGAARMVLK